MNKRFHILLIISLLIIACAPKVVSGDLFLFSEIVNFVDSFKIVGYNLSENPPETYLIKTDNQGKVIDKRLIGKSLFLKDSHALELNTALLFNSSDGYSVVELVNSDGIKVQSKRLDFTAEKLLLHPNGGYVIPGHKNDGKPIVVTLDAFFYPSKIIDLNGDYLMDAVMVNNQLAYITMNKNTRKCSIYKGSSESIYEFTNNSGYNCALTTIGNLIQLHTQQSKKEINITKFNVLDRMINNQSYIIKKCDFFQVFVSSESKIYYLTQYSDKKGNSTTNFYTLYGDDFSEVKFKQAKNDIYSYPFEVNGTVFSTGYHVDINGANHNEIVVLP